MKKLAEDKVTHSKDIDNRPDVDCMTENSSSNGFVYRGIVPQRESSKRNESGLLRKPAKVVTSAKGLMASKVHKGPNAASATLRNFSSYGDDLEPEEGLSAEALRHRNSPKLYKGNSKLDIKNCKTQGTGSTCISGPASFDEKEQ